MREYSLSELLRLTRRELSQLHAQITTELPSLDEEELATAQENIRRIRRAIVGPRYVPS